MAKVTTDNSNYTAIAQAIREKNGLTEKYKPAEMASAILGIQTGSGGTDTSDATATASDMASGVTAYVKGEKITGTASTIQSGFGLTPTGVLGENSTNIVSRYNFSKSALQTVYDALNQGQRKQIIKDEAVKALFDLYGVEYSE